MLRLQPVAALLLAAMTAIPLSDLLAAEAGEKPAPRPGTAGGWPELSEPAALERAQGVKEKLMLVSWGDLIFFYGPETDAGLYNRGQIERMMSYWKRGGFTQVYWRSEDLPMPDWEWNRSTIYAEASFIKAEAEKIRKREDTTRAARELAKEMGMQFYFWHSIYDEGTPPGKKHRFWNAFPWRHTFFDENPGLETVDRNGEVQWGVPEMAYPAVRKRKIDQYLEFVRKYEPDGVLVYLHSHSGPGLHGDQYGFNEIIVNEYWNRYGIDILTDPRFDCTNPDFDQKDPMVEKWRDLRGEHLTQFLRELRAELAEADGNVRIAINTQGGDYFGPPFGNMKIDWRTWIREGLIDVLVVRTWMAGGCGAYDFSKEHYLTWGDGSIGVTSYEEIREEIDRSGNKVLLISRTRAFIPGVDGYYDATNRDVGYVKNQREEQLAVNLKRHGSIGWIEQDFEGLESLGEHGHLDWRSGSQRYFIGDPRYHAGKNTSPGLAGPLTTDPAHSPALVDVSGLGGRGTAVCLREGGRAFEIIRRTGRDWPDDPISKGKAVLSFDIMRKSPAAFAVTTLLNQRYVGRLPAAAENNLQLKTNDSGSVSLWNGKEWSVAASTLPERSWVNLSMELDYEQGKCALKIDGQTAASEILDSGKQWFDATAFACETSEVYIDNISIRWSW
ncbi:family 10 glycosylhydrolase [Planctomycetota bacterium]